MDKQALLDQVKSLWPDAITLRPDDAGQSALNNIYWPVEERLAADAEEWLQVGAWAFHQALGELARSKVAAGLLSVRPSELSFEAFDHWMRKNLADETWSEIWKDYDASL